MSRGPVQIDAPERRLDDRAVGWLRFLWDKATTPDDWSDEGEPHPWWDRYSQPPMCAFPRFDVAEMSYAPAMMMEVTPAWREVYERILDELLARYVSFWGAVDWNTLIGPDPNVDRYPPEWLVLLPERLRGRYAMPGWTANGVEPWGLQPDPVGCDGNLFYRGWLNLLLGLREYVSGRGDEAEVFEVSGYRNRRFAWSHERIANFISAQVRSRPQGPHCENTKIWPFCVSAAGLGLRLYDSLFGTALNEPFLRWIEFAKRHYMSIEAGELEWFALYHDPIEEVTFSPPGPLSAYSAIAVLHYLQPQDPELCGDLFRLAMRRLGWSDPSSAIRPLLDDPQTLSTALWMARELGDADAEDRLRDAFEARCEPRWFGAGHDRFGYWADPRERWPRGQLSATMMMAECAPPGAWSRIFTSPILRVHSEPTLFGVDYPLLGIRSAHNRAADDRGGPPDCLWVETYAADPSAAGSSTSVRVDRLPPGPITVAVDGEQLEDVRKLGAGTIEIPFEIGDRTLSVHYERRST